MGRVLLIDDEPAVLFTLREVLVDRGHEPVTAASGEEALAKLEGVDAVVTDLAMPKMGGLDVIRAVRERDASLPVIVLTAHGNERVAVEAMKAGAHDYLAKPFDNDELCLAVERALEMRHLRQVSRRLAAEQAIGRRVIGQSTPMKKLSESIARVADKDVTVLVRGETGTGKELVGAMIHAQSKRANGALVRFNCAAIPSELAEAELFGHVRGAFTGAQAARRGFFAQADGGTLILDEVGELALPVQAKLLRALQEGEIQPVGSGRVERVDVRIVACTNRHLRKEAEAGRFREDLYYRLAVIELVVPPLRERREDIRPLAHEFARRYADKFGMPDMHLSPSLVDRLEEASYPGNVRQLENTIARLIALSNGGVIDADALPPPSTRQDAETSDEGNPLDGPSLREQVEAFERNLITRALSASGGNQSEAARRLATSRATLVDKIKKYRLGEVE